MKCHQGWNVTKDEKNNIWHFSKDYILEKDQMWQKIKCHKISSVPKYEMSQKKKYLKIWNVTKYEISHES